MLRRVFEKQAIHGDEKKSLFFLDIQNVSPSQNVESLESFYRFQGGYLALATKNGGFQQESPFSILFPGHHFQGWAVSFREGTILQFCVDIPYDWIDQNTFFWQQP